MKLTRAERPQTEKGLSHGRQHGFLWAEQRRVLMCANTARQIRKWPFSGSTTPRRRPGARRVQEDGRTERGGRTDGRTYSAVIHKVESTTKLLAHSVVFPTLWMSALLATGGAAADGRTDQEAREGGGAPPHEAARRPPCRRRAPHPGRERLGAGRPPPPPGSTSPGGRGKCLF